MSINTPVLQSERLRLTPLSLEHLSDDYVNWMNDSEINAFLESGGDYTIKKLKEFLSQVERNSILFWAIHIKDNNKHIGNIKIDPLNVKHKYGEYGIMMGDRHEWGKGYANEASQLVISYCFTDPLNFRKINLGVYSKNISAINLYKKLGFVEEGRYIKHVITKTGFDDIIRMAIFNPSYE